MTTLIASGMTLRLGSGAIIQGGSATPPPNVEYNDILLTQTNGSYISLTTVPEGSLMLLCVASPQMRTEGTSGDIVSFYNNTPTGWQWVTGITTNAGANGYSTGIYWKIKQSGDTSVYVQYAYTGILTSYSNASGSPPGTYQSVNNTSRVPSSL